MANRRFEDFEVGRELHHRPGRTDSRPGPGIDTVETVGKHQDGVVVIEFERTVLILKRKAADVPA